REAEFLVDVTHENVIAFEGFVEELSKNVIWLVFPWKDNGNLRDFAASGDWRIPERISLIRDVCRGVDYLHSRRPPICHGDLKSVNILVNSEYHAVITDFGSARPSSFEATLCTSTNTITLTGDRFTLRWAAPELLQEYPSSLQSDIWALGWVAYEVMTNSFPFKGVGEAIVIKRVIQGDLP
ncbi:hypothetical protein M407DRAFT_37419, partial [Tulasnella calospora MUT 4182]